MALLAGGGLGLLVAFGAGWLLAGAALRPIDRIIQTARAIGAERDFTRRVAYRGPNDEVGRLATTFNVMLTELHATYRQVAQALQAQRRFVGDASHELRTPLTTIRGNLELLRREPPIGESDRRAVLSDTIDETERLARLVNDLLALARADAGWQPALDPVAVDALVEEVCRQARLLAPDRPIVADVSRDVTVVANRDLLKQVLLILVDNALKHTPPSGAVTIAAMAEGEQVALGVRDEGPGIAPDMLPHLFERFYRGDSARTEGGTGLGLAIARALVEAQGGAIAVESCAGAGSVFTVRLPRDGRLDET
jgi:signal transduction histidine kinase